MGRSILNILPREVAVNFNVITLFPEMFSALRMGITGRALEKQLITLNCWNPRDYVTGSYGKVDDHPYGGGPGMVMMVEPLRKAIGAARATVSSSASTTTIQLTPQGELLNQQLIKELSVRSHLILVSGRYEGIDERITELEVDVELSIGDYILSGGELAAMVLIDAITRTLPGALGDEDSAAQDSFSDGLLDYPHYTRPENIAGKSVPKVLLSGNHQAIARWRRKQALGRTWHRRPELLQNIELTAVDRMLLNEFIDEFIGETKFEVKHERNN